MEQLLPLTTKTFFDERGRRGVDLGWGSHHYCFPGAVLSLLIQAKWREDRTPGFWMERRKYRWFRNANGMGELFINVAGIAQCVHDTGETLSVTMPLQTSLVVKNPPCNAGDVSWIPCWGTKIAHTEEQLSPWTATAEPSCSRALVPQQKTPRCKTKTQGSQIKNNRARECALTGS